MVKNNNKDKNNNNNSSNSLADGGRQKWNQTPIENCVPRNFRSRNKWHFVKIQSRGSNKIPNETF